MAILLLGQPLWQQFMVAGVIGWACIGLPVVLPLPSRLVAGISSPLTVVSGACLGPLALAAMFVTTAVLHSILGFGLATLSLRELFRGTEALWPTASLVSTAAIAVYSALIRQGYRQIRVS